MAYTPYANINDYLELSDLKSIPQEDVLNKLRQASRHIDSLTYNRIRKYGFDNLTEFQKEIICEVVCRQADFEYENQDLISSVLSSYSINGVSMLSLIHIYMGFDKSLIMAHPIKYGKSPKWEGRGQSIFDKKTDDFDALDEAWSQWMDALRKGRSKEWIPESLLPRNPDTGAIIKSNAFDNSYIIKGDDMSENSQNKIEVTQPAIPHDSYLATYITALDLCLQGLISPSTLGIDVKKLDNADAQREKEKTTLYTRGNVVDILQDQIPLFIQKVFDVVSISQNNMPTEIKCTIDFSEYANPSFESQVETVGKAKTQGIMSVEASVDELSLIHI